MSRVGFAPLVLLFLAGILVCIVPHPLVLLLLPMAILGGYLVFTFPFWVCLGFILFSFFRLHEAFPLLNPLRIPQLLAVASFAVLGWHVFISNKIQTYWTPLLSHISVLFIFVVVGALMATNRGEAMAAITGSYFKIFVMVIAIAWLARQEKEFNLAACSFTAAGVLIALVAINNKLNGIGLVEGTRVTIGRDIGSMIGDPNDLALVLTFPLSFAVSMAFTRSFRWTRRLLAVICYCVIAWGIIATQSRGGLLGIMAVTGVVTWRNTRNKIMLLAVGFVVMNVLLLMAGISDRASGGANEDGIDESAMGRIYAWGAAWNMALAHPILGVGIDNFYSNYYFYSDHWDGKNHAVHSTWFQVLAETGFVGFAIFLSLVVRTLRVINRCLKQIECAPESSAVATMMAQALLSGTVGFCVSGTFLTQGFIWPLYILMALTIALNQYLQSAMQLQKNCNSPPDTYPQYGTHTQATPSNVRTVK